MPTQPNTNTDPAQPTSSRAPALTPQLTAAIVATIQEKLDQRRKAVELRAAQPTACMEGNLHSPTWGQ